MEGYFLIHRSLFENWLWKRKPFSYGAAWIDLIGLANYQPGFIFVRGMRINIKRGQVGWSVVKMADRWGWSRKGTQTFLKYLKTEQQIEQQKNNITSIITITNYDRYQIREQQKEQQGSSKTPKRGQQNGSYYKEVIKKNNTKPNIFLGKSDYSPSEEEAKLILKAIEDEKANRRVSRKT